VFLIYLFALSAAGGIAGALGYLFAADAVGFSAVQGAIWDDGRLLAVE
jgi:hypothetical protein